MKIGFLIIGSEVLDGKITDLNTKILAEFLRDHSLEINEALVVRDHEKAIKGALEKLFHAHDLVVTSGGLGPTKDDITKETLASFLGRNIVINIDAIKIAEENYARFGRTFPGKDHGYAYLPEHFIPLSNSTGFAPGFCTRHGEKFLFSGPGVPREFKSMLHDHLMSFISEKLQKTFLKHVVVRTKNIPEEKIFNEVDPTLWGKLAAFGEVSSLPILMGVDIGVKIKTSSEEEADQKVKEIMEIFEKSPVQKAIWNTGSGSIEEKIVQLANKKNLKFGFAESASGGLCSHRITAVPGSSHSFMGSVVCYDERIKENILGVKSETLQKFTAVSPQTAIEMAEGLLAKYNLDIALSITGYAGPGGGTLEFPVGTVCIGTAVKNQKTKVEVLNLKGDRDLLKQRFSQAALYSLLSEVEHFA
jgi:nicotinamide-nucleotide amidase